MYKSLLILFNIMFTLMLNVIFGDGVKVTQNAPSKVKPGDEFTVELIVNKTDVSGFAKIQQDLPEGFTAEAIETQGASFTFNEQKVKLIWMSLPESEEFTIKYKVIVDENTEGDFEITGKFSYLHNNERKTVDLNGNFIKVSKEDEQPVAEVTEEPKVDEVVQPETTEPTSTMQQELTVSTERNITQDANGDYIVSIKINHNGIEGFSKIQETLPTGITTADGINTKNAVFSFVDGQAKFVWMAIPADNEISISYAMKGNTTEEALKNMTGSFAYLENEETKRLDIVSNNVVVQAPKEEVTEVQNVTPTNQTDSTEDQKLAAALLEAEAAKLAAEEAAKNAKEEADRLAAEEQARLAAEEAKKAEEAAKLAAQQKANEEAEQLAAQQKAKEDAERLAAEEEARRKQEEEAAKTTASTEPTMTSTPAPQTGVNYKVQICAGHEKVNVNTHFEKEYKFTEEAITTENHEGWIKYTIGSYDTYKNARDRRNVVTDGYSFPGPFVTAYNSGQRITVQEALMISNQKWVQ